MPGPILLFVMLAILALPASARPAAMPKQAIAGAACLPMREPVTIRLADFDSAAEIAAPPAGLRVRAVAVLFAGSDIADKDGTIVGADDAVVSRPLRQVADRLACAGIASLRYAKRYVTGATTADRAKFDRLTGADLATDGRTAVAFVRARPAFAHVPVALVGWSEGTTVAMAVAAAEPDVRAAVLMAPVVDSPAATVQRHYLRVGKPYLERYAKAGALDADAIARADAGPGGPLPRVFVRMFRGFAPGERINRLLDTNKDGRIAFAEADAIIAGWYADTPGGGLGINATGAALKGVAAAYSAASPPILILQGLNDANVDPAASKAFAARPDARRRVTLRTYPGLGHSLGPAASMTEDRLLPTADAPLSDMVGWLTAILHRSARCRAE